MPLPGRVSPAIVAAALLAPAIMLGTGALGFAVDDPPRSVFLGFGHLAMDANQYASFVRQTSREGRIITENRFTTEPQRGRFFFPFFVLVGAIERLTGLPLWVVWHGMGYLAGAGFLIASLSLAARVLPPEAAPAPFLLLLAYGGGWGFLPKLLPTILGGLAPYTDTSYPRGITTFGAFWNPYGVASNLLAVLALREVAGPRRLLPLALLTALAIVNHAYTGLLLMVVLAGFPVATALVAGKSEGLAALRGLAGAWVGIAAAVGFILWQLADPGFAGTSSFFFRSAPLPPAAFLLGLGTLLPLAFVGISALSARPQVKALVLAWLGGAALLAFNPFLLGAKFQFGFHLPLTLAAAAGWPRLARLAPAPRALVVASLFASWPFVATQAAEGLASPLLYASAGEIAASETLAGMPPGNVLSSLVESSRIAWLAPGMKVYVGHSFITRDWERKAAEVDRFFRSPGLEFRRQLLAAAAIDYVYWPRRYSEPGTVPGFDVALSNDAGVLYARHAPATARAR